MRVMIIYRFLKPSAAQRPAAAFRMALVAHALLLKQLLKSVFYYSVDQWRNYPGPQGPQLREDPYRKRPYSARWRLMHGGHFLDPAAVPKLEVRPLVMTLFSCFKKIYFTPTRRQKDSNFKPK